MASLRSGISSHTHLEKAPRIQSSLDHTTETVTCVLCECGSVHVGVESERSHLPNGLDDFMSSIMVFILKTQRGNRMLNTSQYDPLKPPAPQSTASKMIITFKPSPLKLSTTTEYYSLHDSRIYCRTVLLQCVCLSSVYLTNWQCRKPKTVP